MGFRVALHTNSGLAHQVRNARALLAGFNAHGISAVIADADMDAPLHVVQGPWYALERWRFANTLYLDRAYWGDPGAVSVNWLQDGEKLRTRNNPHRPLPGRLDREEFERAFGPNPRPFGLPDNRPVWTSYLRAYRAAVDARAYAGESGAWTR